MKRTSIDDLEELEKQVISIAAQETRLLIDEVATPDKMFEAAIDPKALQHQTAYKKNVSATFGLCERIVRYVVAKRMSLVPGAGYPEEEIERAQQIAAAGIQRAQQRLYGKTPQTRQ